MNIHGKARTAVSPGNRCVPCALVPDIYRAGSTRLIRFLEFFYAVAQCAMHELDAR